MIIDRKRQLIDHVISASQTLFKSKSFFLSPLINCPGKGVPDGKYYLQITKVSPSNLLFQEMVLTQDGDNIIFRMWTFKKGRDWDVLNLEKNKKHIYLREIT